jgi:hypothetical protein
VEGSEGGLELGETVRGDQEGTDSLLVDGQGLDGGADGSEVGLGDGA